MNSQNNTLVILTPGFPQSEADTTCLPMQQSFIRSLKDNNPNLKIIILSFQYPYHTIKYNWFGIDVIPFSGRNKAGLLRLLLQKKIFAALKEIHQANKIIGLLSFWYGECAWVGKKFGAGNHLKHYCWISGQDAKIENKYPGKIKPIPGELIGLSDFLQDEFEKNHGIRPLHVFPPGINSWQLNSTVKEKNIDILAAGSLIPLKQFHILPEMIAEIKKELPGIQAMLVGKGPEKERLQKLILKYGLGQNIKLTGELPHDKVLQLMQRTKVLLHPSNYEGFSGVCQEALSAGAHVISFCKPMKQEIEQWQIVQNKDEMKQKTLELLQNPDSVFKSVIPFSMDDTAKKMLGLFNG